MGRCCPVIGSNLHPIPTLSLPWLDNLGAFYDQWQGSSLGVNHKLSHCSLFLRWSQYLQSWKINCSKEATDYLQIQCFGSVQHCGTMRELLTTLKSDMAPFSWMSALTALVGILKCWLLTISFLLMSNSLHVASVRYNDTTPNGCSSATAHNKASHVHLSKCEIPLQANSLVRIWAYKQST